MKDEYLCVLGKRIKEYRNNKGMSMQELADKAGYDSRASIFRIENGSQDIPHRKLQKIAGALDVDIKVLLDGIDVIIETDIDPLQAKYGRLNEKNRIRLMAYLDALIDSQEDDDGPDTSAAKMG